MTSPQESYRTISLTKGQVAIVDREDYERLSKHKWYAAWNPPTRSFYAVRGLSLADGRKTTIRMHRELMNLEVRDKKQVDHKNHDTLDNRRRNLRIATNRQNACHQRRRSDNTSGYKGVTYFKPTHKWRARIHVDGRSVSLGLFPTPENAYRSYCEAAKRLYGEFAQLV